jgi:ankyrin repeat protein
VSLAVVLVRCADVSSVPRHTPSLACTPCLSSSQFPTFCLPRSLPCSCSCSWLLQALVNAGADVSFAEPSLHETVLLVAAREGFINIVRYLASLDACDIGHRNKDGATAESIAEAEGHLEVVAALQVRATCLRGMCMCVLVSPL